LGGDGPSMKSLGITTSYVMRMTVSTDQQGWSGIVALLEPFTPGYLHHQSVQVGMSQISVTILREVWRASLSTKDPDPTLVTLNGTISAAETELCLERGARVRAPGCAAVHGGLE
jgi:hypothetical protein